MITRSQLASAHRRTPDTGRIKVILPQDDCFFQVPRRELEKDGWGRRVCTGTTVVYIRQVRAPVFNLYALWLNSERLNPCKDISKPLNASTDTPMTNANNEYDSYSINIIQMSEGANDGDPSMLSPARGLVLAYAFGQFVGAPNFQDAVMNEIMAQFTPDAPLSVSFVRYVYINTYDSLRGLRKFLVDYYIWYCNLDGPVALRPAMDYGLAFKKDVHDTVDFIGATRVQIKENKEPIVDFTNVWKFLRDYPGGGIKCRYHQHSSETLCFNYIA